MTRPVPLNSAFLPPAASPLLSCRSHIFLQPFRQSYHHRRRLPVATAASPRPKSFPSSVPPGSPQSPSSLSIEHQNVPAAHRGLHDALYPVSAEDEHGSASRSEEGSRTNTFEDLVGEDAHSVSSFLALADTLSSKVAAVYGILDSSDRLVYVGLSRNVALNIRCHVAEFGAETVAAVRLRTFAYPRRVEMEHVRDAWVAAAENIGCFPPGNADPILAGKWASSVSLQRASSGDPGKAAGAGLPLQGMTIAEQVAFEEKKFKLRKAMADPSLIDELEAADRALDSENPESVTGGSNTSIAPDIQRQRLQAAVEQEDWSGEIDAQTSATMGTISKYSSPELSSQSQNSTPTTAKGEPKLESENDIVSPFAGDGVVDSSLLESNIGGAKLELTLSSVDNVLEEVRPYLASDGGNISVLSVSPSEENPSAGATVTLQLEGACGTCPSSTMTMELGVERVLRERFGDSIGEIVAVKDPIAAVKAQMSIEACDAVLDEVRPILAGLGHCSVETKSVSDGNIVLQYNGPLSLSYAMEHLLKEKLPGVRSVTINGVF